MAVSGSIQRACVIFHPIERDPSSFVLGIGFKNNHKSELDTKMFSIEVVYLTSYAFVISASLVTLFLARRSENAKQPALPNMNGFGV